MSRNVTRLLECLADNRDAMIQQWLAHAIKGISSGGPSLLSPSGDEFHSPVGHILRTNLPVLFDALHGNHTPESYQQALDSVVRLLAVQGFPASETVGFVFVLKEIVRQTIPEWHRVDPDRSATALLESRIDAMALRAFDIFMECREQWCKIRLNESRRRNFVSARLAAKRKDGADDRP